MIRAILERVERREIIIDEAIRMIDGYYMNRDEFEAANNVDNEVAVPTPAPPVTMYTTGQVKQSRRAKGKK